MKGSSPDSSFEEAAASLEAVLAGPVRHEIIAEVSKSRTFDRAARYLRDGMRSHRFEAEGQAFFTGSWVKPFDRLTRADRFHVLHDWDGVADRFGDEMIPVEVTNFAGRMARLEDPTARRTALAILLDYYFLHLLALLALRAWGEGEPNANLDRIDGLLAHLQGPAGSGQPFARDASALLLIATSHFEPDVTAYDDLLRKVRLLNIGHRLSLAKTHAAILGGHLRFGLEVTCAGSLPALRDDNIPDYPWLCEALATLLEAYPGAKGRADEEETRRITEPLFLGLLPDPEAFLGPGLPVSMSACAPQRARVRELFAAHGPALLRDFEEHRPGSPGYSPLSFTFNFPHNLVKGIVVDAVLRGRPWSLSLGDLLTAFPTGPDLNQSRGDLAIRLMSYALASPDTIRGRPHPAIVFDPAGGVRWFEKGLGQLQALNQARVESESPSGRVLLG